MDEVRRRAHVGAQVLGVGPLEHLKRVKAAFVAILADERVHGLVLAECMHARREHNQLAAVRHRHARTIHGLVAEPGARELGGVEVHHAFPDAVLHVVDILLLRELHGLGEAVASFADEEPVRMDLAAGRGVHRQHPENRALRKEMLERIVEETPDGRMVAAHRLLHAAHRPDHVGLVDHVRAAASHEEVLRVVGHADHLVRDDLSGRNDKIVRLIHDTAVHLHAHGVGPETAGDLLHGVGRHLAELHHVRTPTVHDHLAVRDVGEHHLPLFLGDRHVRAKRWHHVHRHAARGQHPVIGAGDEAGIRVVAREVRRDDEHAPERTPFKRLLELDGDLVIREALGRLRYPKKIHLSLLPVF